MQANQGAYNFVAEGGKKEILGSMVFRRASSYIRGWLRPGLGLSLLIAIPGAHGATPPQLRRSAEAQKAHQANRGSLHPQPPAPVTELNLVAVREWTGTYSVKYVDNFTGGNNRYARLETTRGHVRFKPDVPLWLTPEAARGHRSYHGKARARASYYVSEVSSAKCENSSVRARGTTTSAYAELWINPNGYSWSVSEFAVKTAPSPPNPCTGRKNPKKQSVGDYASAGPIPLPHRSPVLCGTLKITYTGVGVLDHHLLVQWMFFPKGQERSVVPDCVHIVKVKRE